MKKLILPFFISLLLFACQQEPVSEITGQAGTDSLPTNTADTATWHKSNPGLGTISNFYFLTAAKGFLAARSGVYRTADSGKTWVPVDTVDGGGTDVFFINPQSGYWIANQVLGSTTDGGITWDIKKIAITSARRVFFVNASLGYITAAHDLYKTTNGGQSWNLIQNFSPVSGGLYFRNADEGWVGKGIIGSSISKGLFKTVDGGVSFSEQTGATDTKPFIYAINFTDSLHGWASNADDTYILKTTDGGDSWSAITTGKRSLDLQFLSNTAGYLAASDGVLKTIDGGTTWNQILKIDATGRQLQEVFFVDENTGWAGDTEGNIYRWSK